MDTGVVTQVLRRLEGREAVEEQNLEQSQQLYEEFTEYIEEEVHDDEAPVISSFLLSDSEAHRKMTNFTSVEFDALWAYVEGNVVPEWTQGRGRKHKTSAKDAFFMTLTVLKHYDAWYKHAADFEMQSTTFQKMIDKISRSFPTFHKMISTANYHTTSGF